MNTLEAIHAEFKRQDVYADSRNKMSPLVDGYVDMQELAAAVDASRFKIPATPPEPSEGWWWATCNLPADDLVVAIRTTFAGYRRDIPDPNVKFPPFGEGFAELGEKRWRKWCDEKFGLNPRYQPLPFRDLVKFIEPFLMQCAAMARGDEGAKDWKAMAWAAPAPRPGM